MVYVSECMPSSDTDQGKRAFDQHQVQYRLRLAVCKKGSVATGDTGISKKGKGSFCIDGQYSGTFGKATNCRAVVNVQGADVHHT